MKWKELVLEFILKKGGEGGGGAMSEPSRPWFL